MPPSVKVLVTGSANDRFTDLFAKVKTLHEKYGPFDVHLCVGNFFTENAPETELAHLLGNQIDVPLTTYFIAGSEPIPESIQTQIKTADGEVCSNVYFLGKRGTLTTAQGLKIAFLSGTHRDSSEESETNSLNVYNDSDVNALKNTRMPHTQPAGVDILLTTEWPSDITTHSAQSIPPPANAARSVAELAAALKPRYHFAAGEHIFFEREPYKNITGFGPPDERAAEHVTRFIGLGDAFNDTKQRWFYAFNMEPLTKIDAGSLAVIPPNTTPCPFSKEGEATISTGQKRPLDPSAEPGNFFWGGQQNAKKSALSEGAVPEGYVCRRCNIPGHFINDCPNRSSKPKDGYVCNICHIPGHHIRDCPERQKQPAPTLDSCWFCLANPKVAKHLIVSIGNEVYITLAKGPVIQSSDNSGVPGGGHILLIPVTHYATFNKIPVETRVDLIAEVQKYKEAIRRMFTEYGQDMVVFELSRDTAYGMSHAHLQIVPIPKDKSGKLESVAIQEAKAAGFELNDQLPDNPTTNYFKMDLPNGKSLVHIIAPKERFNLQFGRLIVATALGNPEREDWKACQQQESEERKDAAAFKAAFKPYDFSL